MVVINAFGAVIRSLICGETPTDDEVAGIFAHFGPGFFEEFAAVLQWASAFAASGVPADLVEMIKPFVLKSWFTCKGVPHSMTYDQGSGAGSPLGDMLFFL